MRWQRIAVATILTTIASWPVIATAPADAPGPSRHIDVPPPVLEPIAVPPRESDLGCASHASPPDTRELEDLVHERRDLLRRELGSALIDDLGGRVRSAVIAQGIAAPSFGWPAEHDVRFGVAVTMAIRALDAGDLRVAVTMATSAARTAPADPVGPILGALAAARLGDRDAQIAFLDEAHARAPDVPAITRVLAVALGNGPDLGRAVRMCDAALDAYPQDLRFADRCARIAARARTFAGGSRVTEGAYVVIAAASVDARVRRIVEDAEASTTTLLGAPRRGSIVIYVYPDRASFDRGTCAEGDDAMFDGTLGVVASSLDTARGESRLRHHVAHAVLSTIAPLAQSWLGEGIAQIVAGPESATERAALDPSHWDWRGWYVNGGDAMRSYAQSRAVTEWALAQPGGILRWADTRADAVGDPSVLRAFATSRPLATGPELVGVPIFPDVVPVVVVRRIDSRTLELALASLRTGADAMRAQAAALLGRYRERDDVLEALERAMVHDESPEVRRTCASGLLHIGNPEALGALTFVAENDEDETVREFAREAIRGIAAPSDAILGR